ncbi:flavin reductase family protein [Actinomadura sp. NAK00032]|uniref:flavin reductase family protein n=1 Tax=Actinomadura sp. NAK00032 TaxID=2742128 RepID=UPI001590500A|nr:flavin reductase family protein [Actinomadura sp. NAK00032]QKW35621.1 flavin reductase family protein [Actinomadura sp. NAK00032]
MTDSIDAGTRVPRGGRVVDEDFRAMMRGFPTGVAVVTALGPDGRARGMTCSSLCSVSLAPPTLLACLREGSPTLAAVLVRGAFAVNLLHADARRTAELFASGAPDRFDRVAWRAGAAGPHLPAAAHAVADCAVRSPVPAGDHVVVFGEVYAVTGYDDRGPLLYGLRRYGSWPRARPGA